jgi:uncharacterized protein YndB with AHSA1/START domain
MAELVREIVIDANPETIWPFLTDPAKHVEWWAPSPTSTPGPAARTG